MEGTPKTKIVMVAPLSATKASAFAPIKKPLKAKLNLLLPKRRKTSYRLLKTEFPPN